MRVSLRAHRESLWLLFEAHGEREGRLRENGGRVAEREGRVAERAARLLWSGRGGTPGYTSKKRPRPPHSL